MWGGLGGLESMTPFDLVSLFVLLGMFILGYIQGVTRRIFGLAAILFSLLIAVQLRQPLGSYLAKEWTGSPPEYSYMIAFGALFLAVAIALTIGIQLFYRPAPLFPRYPALDEILGGAVGAFEGLILLMVLVLVLDPYYATSAGQAVSGGEFGPLRTVHDLLDDSLTASFMREQAIPNVLSVVGWLFPQDIVDTFATAVLRLLA
jgi:uncharacterized membrane protein required for colicin V production